MRKKGTEIRFEKWRGERFLCFFENLGFLIDLTLLPRSIFLGGWARPYLGEMTVVGIRFLRLFIRPYDGTTKVVLWGAEWFAYVSISCFWSSKSLLKTWEFAVSPSFSLSTLTMWKKRNRKMKREEKGNKATHPFISLPLLHFILLRIFAILFPPFFSGKEVRRRGGKRKQKEKPFCPSRQKGPFKEKEETS